MKSTLRIKSDPEIELEVGASDLANLIGSMPDTADEKVLKVLEVLASHPASAVRIAIACKDNLTAETVATLSVDKEINVLRQLVNTNKGRELLETSQLMKMIGFDNELAQSIASYVERYENADVEKLSDLLIKHSDPGVRLAAANNSGIAKKFLKMLLKDDDLPVREAAKRSLS